VQNIENKGAGKILPRKILHPKDLDVKYSTQRSYGNGPELTVKNACPLLKSGEDWH
jgi:hypothetical protein